MKFYRQKNINDCSISCIKTILHHYKIPFSDSSLTLRLGLSGASVKEILDFFDSIGIESKAQSLNIDQLKTVSLPSILFWNQNHFLVIYKIQKDIFKVIDPSCGIRHINLEQFKKKWLISSDKGVVIEIRPESVPNYNNSLVNTFEFRNNTTGQNSDSKNIFKYLLPFKREIFNVTIFLFLGSVIQLIIPFLTQSIVDKGIKNSEISFIFIILLAQIALFIGSRSMDFIRSWIMLNIGIRISVDLADNYVKNLLTKSTSFFDSKQEGDFLQRLFDNIRIEHFLTNSSMMFIVAILNLIVFGVVLAVYSWIIFLIFIIASFLIIIWMIFFLNIRKVIDNERFAISSEGRSKFLEIINGIEEIKINNLQINQRHSWLQEQKDLLKIRLKLLLIGQYQKSGAMSINQLKNVLLTFISAKYVLIGDLTIGSMLAIQYLIGQLNQPVTDIISFIQNNQDARLSMDRLAEVYDEESYESGDLALQDWNRDINISNVCVTLNNNEILKNISLKIPYGNYIAIVGESGCGKTTLLKTMCKFIPPTSGNILLNNICLQEVSTQSWMDNISVVSQEGYIFAKTIKFNITLEEGDEKIDYVWLKRTIKLSKLRRIINNLSLGIDTKIGKGGKRLSKGQIQRILIARAIYKRGAYLLIDEASSSLDNLTESKVMDNLKRIFKDKTIIAVAHKLKTIRDADTIVFLEDGKIVEIGSHDELIANEKNYYNLINGYDELIDKQQIA